jgi:ribonucleotide reductase alpha subunit
MVDASDALARGLGPVDNLAYRGRPLPQDALEQDLLESVYEDGRSHPHGIVVAQNERGIRVTIDRRRDANLTEFGKATLSDRYLMPGESYQDLFARVAMHFADDSAHAQRLYTYMSSLWFMPSTPILSNSGTQRGLPISCFSTRPRTACAASSTMERECLAAALSGGIGSWGNLRSIGGKIGLNSRPRAWCRSSA